MAPECILQTGPWSTKRQLVQSITLYNIPCVKYFFVAPVLMGRRMARPSYRGIWWLEVPKITCNLPSRVPTITYLPPGAKTRDTPYPVAQRLRHWNVTELHILTPSELHEAICNPSEDMATHRTSDLNSTAIVNKLYSNIKEVKWILPVTLHFDDGFLRRPDLSTRLGIGHNVVKLEDVVYHRQHQGVVGAVRATLRGALGRTAEADEKML